jgi:hypothetical protein
MHGENSFDDAPMCEGSIRLSQRFALVHEYTEVALGATARLTL